MRRRVLGPGVLALSMALALGNTAEAAPVLQLDVAGGTYDASTQTIVASSNPFTLIALGTPQGKVSTSSLLADTFYISMAISPVVLEPGASLGSFSVNGQTVRVTEDMVFGKPPLEVVDELQGFDPGDLQGHGIYPTYFAEFEFQFSPTATTATYNTQDRAIAGGPGITPGTGSFFHEFVIDTSMLDPRYVIHFDLYNSTARRCGRQERELSGNDPACVDMDVDNFAPYSHDAQSPPVPEPATMLLFGTGLAAGAIRKYRQRRPANV